ncbi:YHYH domain-containing protein [Aeromonas allosaccharophila]|nr:YHYH domain-containing protein [Aeromonas allosaccharophila]
MKKWIALFFVTLIATSIAQAHSGGTDANGCHAGTKPYHCH